MRVWFWTHRNGLLLTYIALVVTLSLLLGWLA